MIDLHTHTKASDGVLTPEELITKAKEAGLSTIAITDHDQISGILPALKIGREFNVEILPGVELSSYWLEKNRKEFHILGYFIDYQNKKLLERLNYFQEVRTIRAKKILELLEKFGYTGEWAYLLTIAFGTIGMPHVARTCLDNPVNKAKIIADFGTVPVVNAFIQKYMIKGKPCYVEKAGFETKEAIDLIHEVGGVAVLAHPCFDVQLGDTTTLEVLKDWGLDGIEAIAPFKTKEETKPKIKYFSKVAKNYNLLVTGGSDYHGIDGIGAGLGLLEWGMEINDNLLTTLKDYYQKQGFLRKK